LPKLRKVSQGFEKAREDGGVHPSPTDKRFIIQEGW
jgi:hypothetical protein